MRGIVPQDGREDTQSERRAEAHRRLLGWYALDGRAHLPWRHTRDPYAILVSEVMLQQTQVERVLPKYREFLTHFPTLASLAAAPTAAVIRAWAGLGYNLRAVRLQEIAQQAFADCDGRLPETLDGLLALKGIGRYTAGAVACFAFNLPVATVDTNIRRVLWRVFRGIEPSPALGGARGARAALALAEWALPSERAYDWQQALMDLGATVCTSRRPFCERCPVAACCAAYAETAQATLFPSGEALIRLRDERALAGTRAAGGGAPGTLSGTLQVAERLATYTTGTGEVHARGRRGAHRGTQEPFAGSSRYFRGRIVAALRALSPGESLPLAALGPSVKADYAKEDADWLRRVLHALARDGLVRLTEGEDGQERAALP
jgi:A/G-specific adenine glycosylase